MTDMELHAFKEFLKRGVDDNENFTEKMKSEIKAIIDSGKTLEEVGKAILAYFSMQKFL